MGTLMNLDISELEDMSEKLGTLYLNEKFSDITICISDENIPTHKAILSARSPYLEDLLKTKDSELHLKNVSIDVFKIILKYIYTGRLSIDNVALATVMEIFELACIYGLKSLINSLTANLANCINIDNVVSIINMAQKRKIEGLLQHCEEFIDKNAIDFLSHKSFDDISEDCLIRILQRDTFYVDEFSIFQAVCKWSNNDKIKAKEAIKHVRLNLIEPANISTVVSTSMVESDVLVKVLADSLTGKKGNQRKLKHQEDKANSVSPIFKFKSSSDKFENNKSLNSVSTFISDSNEGGTYFELNNPIYINHIQFDLDKSKRYNYYIEVCDEHGSIWVRVIDYTRYKCHSEQLLYFSQQRVKYIHIINKEASTQKAEYVDHIKVLYLKDLPKIAFSNVPIPNFNIATKCQVEVEWRGSDYFLSTWEFSQPYVLDSLQFKCSEKLNGKINAIEVFLHGETGKCCLNLKLYQKTLLQSFRFKQKVVTTIQIILHGAFPGHTKPR